MRRTELMVIRNLGPRTVTGGKGLNLMKLKNAGLTVPEFFIVTPEAFFESLPSRLAWSHLGVNERVAVVENLTISPKALTLIIGALNQSALSGTTFAVRSSQMDEDGYSLSYAGQFASVLNVEIGDIGYAIGRVWRSAFSKQVLAYRRINGLSAPPEPPCVIIQEMVEAKLSGVAFGADPITGDTGVIAISAVNGLGDKLVSGEIDAATYRLRGSLVEQSVGEEHGRLTPEQLAEVRALVERTGEIFGCPQDVEWAIDMAGRLFVLQARPITTLRSEAGGTPALAAQNSALPVQGRLDIFDNSNIGESYPGVTTPLTFSFARKAYQHVYESFCRLMGVSERAIEAHASIFPQMLGFVRGRIYYNLLNWYRLLSLFPGFKTNRGFMEQMMGVKAGLPVEFLSEFDRQLSTREKIEDAVSVGLLIPKLGFNWARLPNDINAFNKRVDDSLDRVPKDLSNMSEDQLAKLYRSLEQDLLTHWDAPIVNDFFAMVSFGLLRGICSKWLSKLDGVHNQLLCGETGIVSTEPVARMKELAAIVAQDSELMELLRTLQTQAMSHAGREGSASHVSRSSQAAEQLERFPHFWKKYKAYLEKFGDRCAGELKLESPTSTDNPQAFLSAIVGMAENAGECGSDRALRNRTDAEAASFKALGNNIMKIAFFQLILWQTRTRIRERENLRFVRTRVFGLVRRIFVQIGRGLTRRGLLDNAQDVFYLETEEVLRFIEGTSASSDLKAIVASRKNEFSSYNSMPSPPDRFTVRGGLNLNAITFEEVDEKQHHNRAEAARAASGEVSQYQGLGCCPGIISGFARVIDDPETQQLEPGEILVAKRTDPGWITVIAQASGIVVEYGSLLSHTAIVARELGIPTIVSVSSVTANVKTGARLEINGATGMVRVIPDNQHRGVALAMADQEEDATLKSEIETKAGFSFVRYAQCWEDTDIVVKAMDIKPGDNCLSIASAGDNSLALLARDPAKVVALDLNRSQLSLLELKAAAFRCLDHDEMLMLLGYRRSDSRLALFERVQSHLSESAKTYWNDHVDDIEYGVARRGKFEQYFSMFRRFVLPLVHSRATVDELLRAKPKQDRQQFYSQKWNTLMWRTLFKLFFCEAVMGKLGRDPSFFTYAGSGLADVLLRWTRKALVDQDPSANPYLHWILKGEFGSVLPNFLRPENFDAIKRNIDRLEWHQSSLEEYLTKVNEREFDSFNLSDVFEYVCRDNYKTIMKLIASSAKPGARVVYWNMMAPRTAAMIGAEDIKSMTNLSETLFAENKTFFYSKFVVEEVVHDEVGSGEAVAAGTKDRAA